jgi:hypothetical protein
VPDRRGGTAIAGQDQVPAAPRLLVATYLLFAVAAGARSLVQLVTKADEAPVAYCLSAVAALTYLTAWILLRIRTVRARQALRVICVIELMGVLTVGVVSVVESDLFPEPTVWSGFGNGYGFVPAILPIAALYLLSRSRGAGPSTTEPSTTEPSTTEPTTTAAELTHS